MDLDHGAFKGIQCVEDSERRVSERSRVDDDASAVLARFVDPVDDLVFAVALMETDLVPQLRRQLAAVRLDVNQCLVPIDMWLALAEEI